MRIFRCYSDRSAWTGSTLAARRAGSHVASTATPISMAATPTKVTGSLVSTPNTRLFINLVKSSAPAIPAQLQSG